MIEATHNIVIVKNQKNIKMGYLKLRTICNRKVKDRSLGIQILLKNWIIDKQRVSKKEPNAEEINTKIKTIINDARGGHANSLTNGDKSFINFAQKVTDAITSPSTRSSKQDALNKFKQYITTLGADDIKFPQIDTFLVQNYYTYLINNLAISSANGYIASFKFFIKKAEKEKKYKYDLNPTSALLKKKVTKKYNVINDDELKKILNWSPDTSRRKDTYEAFLFMMHAGGIRISDTLLLRFDNIMKVENTFYLNYRIKKTGIPMQTKLTLPALIHLFHFMGRFDDTFDKYLNEYLGKSDALKQQLKEYKLEKRSIVVQSFYRIKEHLEIELAVGADISLLDIINQEEKKQNRKIYLKAQISWLKTQLHELKEKLVGELGGILMELKNKYPKTTLLPYMNDYYDGEHILSKAQEDQLSRFKVHFCDHLKKTTERIGLNTRITPHQARHIFAQRLFLNGANMHYISMALGHTTLKVTESYRQQLVTDTAMNVADTFTSTLKGVYY